MDMDNAAGSPAPKVTRRTRITFDPGSPLAIVPDTVRSLDLPLPSQSRFALEFALSEVLLNALRATAKQSSQTPCIAEILDDGDSLAVTVEDSAGGFDIRELPYDFTAEAGNTQVDFEALDQYRTMHDGQRFGLGLLLTRAMVEGFSLAFVDDAGRETPWRGPGSVHGTRVRFRLKRTKEEGEQRRQPRQRARGDATTTEGLRARVGDLSMGGVRLIFGSRPLPLLDETYDLHIRLEAEPPVEIVAPARIARVQRIGACYDVGATFTEIDELTRADLKRIIKTIKASGEPGAIGKVRVELLDHPDNGC